MEYKIEWMENKTTTTGKNKIDCTLKDVSGVMTENVTIWGDFPNFASLMPGSNVSGNIVPAKDSKYGPTLYPPKATSPGGGNMSKMMDKKAENIKEAQERKSDSIAYFNAINSAIALAGVTRPNGEAETKMFITEWRDWFLSEWEKHNQKVPF